MAIIEKPIMGKPQHRFSARDTERLIASISKYTKFVLLSKISLGILSVLMILGIIIIPVLNADEEGLRIAFSTVKDKADSLPSMEKPTFQGVDENNQPYIVRADSALQHDEHTIILKNVQAMILAEGKTWLSVQAKSGTIDTQAKTMRLNDDIRLIHEEGHEFRTQAVDIDMNTRIATSTEPVNGFGPMGEISADGFSWQHEQRIMRFTGNVKLKVRADG